VFFAYVGFEAVSTAAGEARNPQRDLPIGIIGSLIICTVIYMAVAMVMTGVVPFRELGVPAPIAVAIDRMNPEWAMIPWQASETGTLNLLSLLIKIGAFAGLTSVMLVLIYAQTRVFYQMARDGLIPGFFANIHKTFKTPAMGTIVLGILIAIAAALLPLGVLGDLVSLGTALAFAIVCISVMYMRSAHPEIARPFKVPLYPITPILGVIACVMFMMGPILIGLASQATGIGGTGTVTREYLPTILLVTYVVIGALVYAFYGFRNSKLTHTDAK
jgi:APA family basic amino acid/polyamine antiporter